MAVRLCLSSSTLQELHLHSRYACWTTKICPSKSERQRMQNPKRKKRYPLESLKKKGLINPSGRERNLPLKILGDGELSVKLSFKARTFSASPKEKLEAAGYSLTFLSGRKKRVKTSVAKNLA